MKKAFVGFCLLLLSLFTLAQNPGNVGTTNLTAWWKADNLPLGNTTSWTTSYPTGPGAITLTDPATPYPVTTNTPPGASSNYNSTVDFAGNSASLPRVLENPNNLNLLDNTAVNNQGTFVSAYFLSPTSVELGGHTVFYREASAGTVDGIQCRVKFSITSGRLSIGSGANSVNASRDWNQNYQPDIVSYTGNRSGPATFRAFTRGLTMGAGAGASTSGDIGLCFGARKGGGIFNALYDGYLAEVIFYNRDLTQAELDKVHTYLAVKYGITLNNSAGGTQGDYTATSGALLWDASVNPGYHYQVIGIGRDDAEGLMQKQSHDFDDQNRIYLSTLQPTNVANTGTFNSDISYVIMGNDQGGQCASSASTAEKPATPFISGRLGREWKVTKTNFSQSFNVDLLLDTCMLPTTINPTYLKLLVDTDGNFTNASVFAAGGGLSFSYSNGWVTVSGISNTQIPDNTTRYITLGYSNPTVTMSAPSSVCLGDSIPLTFNISNALGPITVYWSDGVNVFSKPNMVNGGSVKISPTSNTIYYTSTGTPFNCCSFQPFSFISVSVKPKPSVSAATTATTVCAGQSVTLTGSGASSYTWDNSVVNGVAFQPALTTTYTVTGMAANGCTDTAHITVNVNQLPPVAINASDDTVCVGEFVTLSGAGANTYSWNNGISNGVAFQPATTTTYTLTGTDGNNCVNTAQLTVQVNPNPSVGAVSTLDTACQGDYVTLNGTGASLYTWDNGVTNNNPFQPASTTTYQVIGTDANGCIDSALIEIVVNPSLTVSISATQDTVCQGNALTLTASGAAAYNWDNGISNGVAFTPAATNTYTVIGSNPSGCADTAQITIQVNPNPVVGALTSADTICAGDNVTLSGTGASTYAWSNGVTNGLPFQPGATATYTVTGTDPNGCQGTAQIAVVIRPALNVMGFADNNPICLGEFVTLNGTGATTFQWDNGVTNNVPFQPAATTTYTVTGTSPQSCPDTGQVTVVVHPLPVVQALASQNLVCEGNSLTLHGHGAATYAWDQGVVNNQPFVPTATATYTVVGWDLHDCTDTASITVPFILEKIVSLGNDTVICGSSPILLQPDSSYSAYLWGDSSTLDTFRVHTPGIYQVTVTDSFGCEYLAQVTILPGEGCDSILIPNVFTPNGDGFNDRFQAKAEFLNSFSMSVFDRWGRQMFSSTSVSNGWDGSQNGGPPCTEGVYYYLIEYSFLTDPTERFQVAGHLTLLR
ncbi:MAG: gliding motility-associated C-terminal domain-containing protein [Bacteroidia bacterium]|nr:gliding motility-associated C-terminal domain-containing protein [Bacteroidia bacterium]